MTERMTEEKLRRALDSVHVSGAAMRDVRAELARVRAEESRLLAENERLRTALVDAKWAMDHLGDILNEMDAAGDDPEPERVSSAFEVVSAALDGTAAAPPPPDPVKAQLLEALGELLSLLGGDPARELEELTDLDFDSVADFERARAQLRAEIAGHAAIAAAEAEKQGGAL